MIQDSGDYLGTLLDDIQGNTPPKENFDRFVGKLRGWGAKAALGLNPKVWANQTVSLFAAHGVGFKYNTLLKGAKKSISGKTDFTKLTEYSPMIFARFREGYNIDTGLLREGSGILGKVDKITEMTLAPISWMDKMVIGAIWNAALEEAKGEKRLR